MTDDYFNPFGDDFDAYNPPIISGAPSEEPLPDFSKREKLTYGDAPHNKALIKSHPK